MEQIKIMLTEDQLLVRKALVSLLDDQPDFTVTGEAYNGKELIELIKDNEPHIVLLDIDMPVMNGHQTLEVIKKRFPNVKVIMLSMHTEPGFLNEFMSNGASAYLSKSIDIEILFEAIRTVNTEGIYFNKDLARALLNGIKREKTNQLFFNEPPLSSKELVILKELCKGKTNKVIADELHLSINTIDFHRGNIYIKTKCKNIAELVKFAIKQELVSIH